MDRLAATELLDFRDLMLPLGGMTCAPCAGRVEKTLLGVSGVLEASDNLATEETTVRADASVPSASEAPRSRGLRWPSAASAT